MIEFDLILGPICEAAAVALPIAASLIGGALSYAGAVKNNEAQIYGAELTNMTNKQIADLNNKTMIQLMREQTKAEQDYNSVGEQMRRAMSAGVNPMLLAGAQPTSASASGVPQLQSPDLHNPFQAYESGLSAVGQSIQGGLMQAKSLELQEGQLDNARVKTQVDTLQTIAQLVGNENLTSSEVNMIVNSVMGDSYQGEQLSDLFRDQFTITRLNNAITTSNIDKDTKQYLYSWLDEFTNAQFTDLLASTEMKQTQSNVNRSLQSLNKEKKKEVVQAVKNMEEEWKSLNATAEMDAYKLKKFAKKFDAEVDKLENEAKLSKKEARYYFWSKLVQHPLSRSWKLGPVGGSSQTHPTRMELRGNGSQPRTDDEILLLTK